MEKLGETKKKKWSKQNVQVIMFENTRILFYFFKIPSSKQAIKPPRCKGLVRVREYGGKRKHTHTHTEYDKRTRIKDGR